MVGRAVVRELAACAGIAVEGTQRERAGEGLFLDACQGRSGLEALGRAHGTFDYVVNCVGVLKSQIDEADWGSVLNAIAVNSVFPFEVARMAARDNSRVIHISTDGVFSGRSEGVYWEDSACDPVDVYGMTKRLGEVPSQAVLNIRCSVIGRDPQERKGLVEWVLSREDHAVVAGYSDWLWNGVTTLQVAELCRNIICGARFDEFRKRSPVYHFCSPDPVSKYVLVGMIAEAFAKKVRVTAAAGPSGPVQRILETRFPALVWTGPGPDLRSGIRQLAQREGYQAGDTQ